MKFNKQIILMHSFVILCVFVTVSLCLYWCYKYNLNEDLSVVHYKQFYETNDDVFPTMSLCLGNPFSEQHLAEYGVNKTSYLEFLKGKKFTKVMKNINYSRVTRDVVDFIKGYRIYFRNHSIMMFDSGLPLQDKSKLVFNSFNGFAGSYGIFYKCFGLQIPKIKDLMIFRILLSNKIFPNGERPTKYLFRTFVHLPGQFMLSQHTDKWIWSHRTKYESYKLRFAVLSADIGTKRNKKQRPCNEYWKEFDDRVIKTYQNETGCNNPYQEPVNNLPMCNTKEEMANSMIHQTIAERPEYTKPCKTMENVRIDHVESNLENTNEESFGEFWVSIGFPLNTFKEIEQTR